MTQSKMTIVPAILAAAVAVVLAATGTASASVLCKAAESPCSEANRYAKGTQLHAVMKEGSFVMKNEFQTGECQNWTFTSKTLTAGSATEAVEGMNETTEAAPCNGVAIFLRTGGYSIHHLTGTSNGQFTMKSFEVLLKQFGVECRYGGTFEAGTLIGGNPATYKINASVPKISGGFLCGEAMTLQSGTIEFTTPKPLYVAAS
jgi:hypothetical protein